MNETGETPTTRFLFLVQTHNKSSVEGISNLERLEGLICLASNGMFGLLGLWDVGFLTSGFV